MKKLFYVFICIFLLSYSCSDDDTVKSRPEESKDYLPSAIGNYWIYDVYAISEKGVETKEKYQDTVTIEREETIKGKKYSVKKYKRGSGSYLPQGVFGATTTVDSLGYILNNKGNILFSNINFTDTISRYYMKSNADTLATITARMERLNKPFTVPAGTFNALNFRETVFVWGRPLDENEERLQNPKYVDTYYSKGVGIIYHTAAYLYSGGSHKWCLAKYCINDVVYPKSK